MMLAEIPFRPLLNQFRDTEGYSEGAGSSYGWQAACTRFVIYVSFVPPMGETLQYLPKLVAFFAGYASWVKLLVVLWFVYSAVVTAVLIFMSPGTDTPQGPEGHSGTVPQSATIHASPNSTINQAGRDINIHNSAPVPPKYTGILVSPEGGTFAKLQLGPGGPIFESLENGVPLFKFVTGSHLTVELENGRLLVSTRIFDRNLKLVAELIKNEWKIAPPPATWDRNYSDDALEVKDDRGEIVLQVRMVTGIVQLQAVYYVVQDGGYAFLKDPQDEHGTIQKNSATLQVSQRPPPCRTCQLEPSLETGVLKISQKSETVEV